MSKKLSPALKPSTMDFVVSGITHVCKTFKRRAPGTQSERDAQDFFTKELGQWSDEIVVEDFTLHPYAFTGFIPFSALFGIISAILFFSIRSFPERSFTFGIIGTILLFIAAAMFFVEFVFYRKFVDFLFPKAVSKNVYATKKPVGEVKRRIIFGGHADAPWEFTFFLRGQMKSLLPAVAGSVGGMLVSLIVTVVYLIMGAPKVEGAWLVVSIVMLCLIPFYIAIMFFTNFRVIVDGANDNLSSCYASMAILKEMTENDFRFENTEVCCLITGSEEAGLRGAKAFSKKHAEELNKVETIFIPFEVLRECDQLTIYDRDMNGVAPSCKATTKLLLAAGKKVGLNLKCATIPLGSTDAAAFSQAGIPAAGVCGSRDTPQTYYHTRLDTYDNISPECIQKAIELGYEAAYMFDAGE